MKTIKEIKKDLNEIYTDYRAEYDKENLFYDLLKIADENDLYIEDFENWVDDNDVYEIIKYNLDSHSWDLMDLVRFMNNVDFYHDDLYILEYDNLRNVRTEDFRDLKDDIIYNLEQPTHYITLEKQSNCYIYGVDIKAYTSYEWENHKIFTNTYEEHTYDLSPVYDEYDEEDLTDEDYKNIENCYIDEYLRIYMEENNINPERVKIINYIK